MRFLFKILIAHTVVNCLFTCFLHSLVPSSGPANVSAFATTSSSVLVRWGEVPETDRNGLILGYKVHWQQASCQIYCSWLHCSSEEMHLFFTSQVVYKEKDAESSLRFWMVEGNTTYSVQLTGLGKYVLYEIQVQAFTRIGDGMPSSPPIFERTLDDGESLNHN